jgi:murein DD-endopeptidase MepM/ murein hydrolase activator NlpD
MRAMRRIPLVTIAVGVMGLVGCGTVSVETTTGSDVGKVGIEAAPSPGAGAVVETTAPVSTTSWAPNLPEGRVSPGGDEGETEPSGSPDAVPSDSTTTGAPTVSTTTGAPGGQPTTTLSPTTTTTTATTVPLEYHEVGHIQFAWAGDLAVLLPVARYETVGFHESGHDGAFQLDVVGITDWVTLASRGRGTGSRTAADIVVPPDEAIIAPVTGVVIRAGTYTLYCDHSDNFVVIEPAGRPGWELKIFHFEGLAVGVGDNVVAGTTVIGSSGRVLPFESQVDEFTAEPSNAHVHLEVIDTSIPDRPSTGGGC